MTAPVGQTVLPFEGLQGPAGIAVDADGNVYLADRSNHRVLKLPAGSSSQIVLPFPPSPLPESDYHTGAKDKYGLPHELDFDGLRHPNAVAVDKAGNIYVGDCGFIPRRVWKLPAGSNTPTVLLYGFGGSGLAVDTADNLYGVEIEFAENGLHPGRLWKLPAPTTPNATPTVLPMTGLHFPTGVALDSEGNSYVVDPGWPSKQPPDYRVIKLPADSSAQSVLPLSDLHFPYGIAMDAMGTAYISDGLVPDPYKAANPDVINRVLKLPAGSNTSAVLPFTGLNHASQLAVRPIWMPGPPDSVYLSDALNNRVLRLGLANAS